MTEGLWICQAQQRGDMTYCQRCRLAWDTNDSNPPECGSAPNATQLAVVDEVSGAKLNPITFIEFARQQGYTLSSYQRLLLEMLDKDVVHRGRKV